MSQPPAALTPPSTGGAIRRNAVYSLLSQIVGAAFTAGLTLFLARRLGTHGFGVYSLALGIGSLVLFPMDFGISTSMARFVAEHRSDRARVAAVVADGMRLKFLLGLAISGGLFALAGPLASAYGTHALLWPIRAIAISLLGQTMMKITHTAIVIIGLATAMSINFPEPNECRYSLGARLDSFRSEKTMSAGSRNITQSRKRRIPVPVRNPSCVMPRKSVARNA